MEGFDMNEMSFYFAKTKLSIPQMEVPESWERFLSPLPYDFEMSLELSGEEVYLSQERMQKFGGAKVVLEDDGWFFVAPDSRWDGKKEGAYWGLDMDKDCKKGIYHSDGSRDEIFSVIHTAVDASLPLHGGSIIHASCIVYQGKAILFCGPSGMGKSTQAKLWEDSFDCYMISSDAPAVLLEDGGAVAYGMPWDGSDQIMVQESAPVAAIIELEQAKENSIRAMEEREAYQRLLQQGHLPLWEQNILMKEMHVLKEMAGRIPFYHLACRPEKAAAELVEKTVFS